MPYPARVKFTLCLALLSLSPLVTVARYVDEVSQAFLDYETGALNNSNEDVTDGNVKSSDDKDDQSVGLFDAPISSDEDLMATGRTIVRNSDGTFGIDWADVSRFSQGLVKAAMPYVINEIAARIVPPMIRGVLDFFRQQRFNLLRLFRIDPESAPPGLIDKIDVDEAVNGGVNMVRAAMNSAAAMVAPKPPPPLKAANPFGDVVGGMLNSVLNNALRSALSGKGGLGLTPEVGKQAAGLLKMVQSVFGS